MEQPIKHKDLVYDVGMHVGEDTAFYLKKGFRVVAFEAQPGLIADCEKKFAEEIKNGRLVIVEGAIVEATDKNAGKTVKFFRNLENSVWGTAVTERASKNEEVARTSNEIIEVPAIDFGDCIRKYGVPHYLKIDIEGMDIVCLRAMTQFKTQPDYVSIESDKLSFDKIEDELNLFIKLGYTGFQAVNQVKVKDQKEPNPAREGSYAGYTFPEGASGLFGAELPDAWSDHEQILKRYKKIFTGYRLIGDEGSFRKYFLGKVIAKSIKIATGRRIPGWYDTHARHSSAGK